MSRLENGREEMGAGPLSKTAIAVAILLPGRPVGSLRHNMGGPKSAGSSPNPAVTASNSLLIVSLTLSGTSAAFTTARRSAAS